jgi:hypothetical protein
MAAQVYVRHADGQHAPLGVQWKDILAHTFEHMYFAQVAAYRHALEIEPLECAKRANEHEKTKLRHLVDAYLEARKTMIANATLVAVAVARRSVRDRHWFVLYYVPHTEAVRRHMHGGGYAGRGMWMSAGSTEDNGTLMAAMPDPIFCDRLHTASTRGMGAVLLPAMPVNYTIEYVGKLDDKRRERAALLTRHAPTKRQTAGFEPGNIPGFFFADIDVRAAYNLLTNNCGTIAAWLLAYSTKTCQLVGFAKVPGNLAHRPIGDLEAIRD